MENKKKSNVMTYLLIGGAYVSFVVGASFSTGNELMQYFASYGLFGILGAIIATALCLLLIIVLIRDAQKYNLPDMKTLFVHYGGKYLGTALYVYTVFYLFVLVVMLVAGAGAVFEEHFGISNMLGRGILTLAMFLTVILGLNKLLDILGKLSFIILIMMIVVALIGIFNPVDGISEGSKLALETPSNIVARQGSNWFMSGLMYFSWAILCQTSFVASLGKSSLYKESDLRKGMYFGGFGFMLMATVPSIAIIANFSICKGSSIPTIVIAKSINPILAVLFSCVVVIAIYTTCSPICWSVANAFIKQEQRNFKWMVAGMLILAFIGSNLGSFTDILYLGTSVSAYVGFVFIATVIFTIVIRKPKGTLSECGTECVDKE